MYSRIGPSLQRSMSDLAVIRLEGLWGESLCKVSAVWIKNVSRESSAQMMCEFLINDLILLFEPSYSYIPCSHRLLMSKSQEALGDFIVGKGNSFKSTKCIIKLNRCLVYIKYKKKQGGNKCVCMGGGGESTKRTSPLIVDSPLSSPSSWYLYNTSWGTACMF